MQVVIIVLEYVVWFDVNFYVQVVWGIVIDVWFIVVGGMDVYVVVDVFGDFYFQCFVVFDVVGIGVGGVGFWNDFVVVVVFGVGLLDVEEVLLYVYLVMIVIGGVSDW